MFVLTTAESRVKIWPSRMYLPPFPAASDAVRSKAVVLLLLIHYLLLLPLFVGVLCLVIVEDLAGIIYLSTPGPEFINFFMLNSTEHEISTAHKNCSLN